MSDNKKYYYLKLKDNFFESEEMIILESMPDGYLYSNILLKLYLRSLKNEGRLMFKDRIPYTPTVLAQILRHQVGTVEKALDIFKELGLIEVTDLGVIYMTDIQNFIGTSSTEADRIRAYRKKISTEKTLLLEESNDTVQMYNKCTPERERKIEKDIEIDIDIEREIEIENFSLPPVYDFFKEVVSVTEFTELIEIYGEKNVIEKFERRKNYLLSKKLDVNRQSYDTVKNWLETDKSEKEAAKKKLFDF